MIFEQKNIYKILTQSIVLKNIKMVFIRRKEQKQHAMFA